MLFYQLFEAESCTYTYLLACKDSKEAILIDPVIETFNRDVNLIKELDLKLLYTVETHIHADHVTSASELKKVFDCKTVVSHHAKVKCADILVKDNDVITFGKEKIKVLETQGHTRTCISLYIHNMIFTGDLLFIRGTGRTDFQEGNSKLMFKNIREKIFSLPDETLIYPGHDYKGMQFSTVELEKKYNPRVKLANTEEDFVKIMDNLNLPYPKKIDMALPLNLVCGNRDL